MKKIVMIGPSPKSHGGISSVIATLIKSGYLKDNKRLFIPTQVDDGVLSKIFIAVHSFFHFVILLSMGRVGVLHVHVASGVSFWRKCLFITTAQLAGCPVIFQLHGGRFRHFIDQQPLWRRRVALKLIRQCNHILALTNETAQWLEEVIHNNPVEVFPNPITFETGSLHTRPMNILFLGRLSKEKGIFDLLRAFAILNKRLPQARLIIGGDGDTSTVSDFSKELGIASSVHFLGWIDENARTEWLNNTAVFVLPSLFEQMPMTILEAMVAGTPVVATSVGAIPDMLDHGNCGLLVEPGNSAALAQAIYSLLKNPEAAQLMAGRAISRVYSTYSADKVLRRLEQLYSSLM